MKHRPCNVNKADFDLKFVLSETPNTRAFNLEVLFGPEDHPFWKRSGLSPVSMIVSKVSILVSTGKVVRSVNLVNPWLTEWEKGLLGRAIKAATRREVEVTASKDASPPETEQLGLFDRVLPPFP